MGANGIGEHHLSYSRPTVAYQTSQFMMQNESNAPTGVTNPDELEFSAMSNVAQQRIMYSQGVSGASQSQVAAQSQLLLLSSANPNELAEPVW